MRAADAQTRELVQGAVEDQPREEVGRLERVADDVAELAPSTERARLDDVLRAVRVHENELTELRRLRPERIVLGQRQVLARHVAPDRAAAQSEPLHGV